ncbi:MULTISPECIES: type II secretion system secretin GspD [unclassified Acidovorax]|uniref:type II secretion system secretin GspD n=1 Tax=unclassified Acidovorax TaxID=2684926 RepID=UPI000C5BBB39|nr:MULTISPECIES: type II secretion system secretin GspD [unclassified Acidovorax]PIF19590.1 general secretion pathway protein D [Acidovorax sp. 59]PKW01382.1 general secretion pathway protein D [Acidovorax sp. 30]
MDQFKRLAVACLSVYVGVTFAQSPEQLPQPADAAPSVEPRIMRGNDTVIAPPRATTALPVGATGFKFEEAPIAEFATIVLKDVLKADYVLHQPLTGSVTLSTNGDISPDQAVLLLESALQANGLVMARDTRGTYHVGKAEAVRGIVPAVRQAVAGAPLPPGSGAIVVRLNYIGASEMAAILRPMAPPEAIVRVDNLRNLLVLAGTRTQAEGWLDLVNTFDVDLLKGMSVGVFPLKYVSVKEVEAALSILGGGSGAASSVVSGGAAGSSTATARPSASAGGVVPSGGMAESNPLFGAFRVLPMERLNSILVVTPRAAYLDEARRWIDKLDQPGGNSTEPQLFIYQVQNVNARHLASVLSGIFGGTAAPTNSAFTNTGVAPGLGNATGMTSGFGASSTPNSVFGGTNSGLYGSNLGNSTGIRSGSTFSGAGGGTLSGRSVGSLGNTAATATQTQGAAVATLGSIRVMADELNNSLLVWSTKAEYAKIEATLKRLDLPLTQVLIEASIVEVTLNDDLEYGLQWAFSDSRANTGYTGSGALSTSAGGVLGGALAGFSYTLKNPAGNVRAVLNALSKKTMVKVIASPSLMVLDNHMASIAVGTQTPIQAGETVTSDGIVRTSIQYKDTGVNLMVTPSVNSGNVVTMQVDQSVTDVGQKDEVSGQRAFLQRQLSSKLAVRSGESIVMGGLIQSNNTTSKSGVPILHSIPVLGNLFGSTSNIGSRTELLVVITPRVVRTDIDIREVSDDLRERMRGLAPAVGTPQPRSAPSAPQGVGMSDGSVTSPRQ